MFNYKLHSIFVSGKLRRFSRYDDEISEGQLGINEKELNSMNKHIPGTFSKIYRFKIVAIKLCTIIYAF